jgi:hypothetical protein
MGISQRVFSAVLLVAAGDASAGDLVWSATVSTDGRSTLEIVDATEAGCNAQVVAYREVVVVQPCQPIEASRADSGSIGSGTSLSPIQDNGDGSRGNGSRSVTGPVGSSGGTAAGGGRAVGGAGNMGGGH